MISTISEEKSKSRSLNIKNVFKIRNITDFIYNSNIFIKFK